MGKPGMLQSMGSQRVRHDLVTEQQQLLLHIFLSEDYSFIHSYSHAFYRVVLLVYISVELMNKNVAPERIRLAFCQRFNGEIE